MSISYSSTEIYSVGKQSFKLEGKSIADERNRKDCNGCASLGLCVSLFFNALISYIYGNCIFVIIALSNRQMQLFKPRAIVLRKCRVSVARTEAATLIRTVDVV